MLGNKEIKFLNNDINLAFLALRFNFIFTKIYIKIYEIKKLDQWPRFNIIGPIGSDPYRPSNDICRHSTRSVPRQNWCGTVRGAYPVA